MVQPRDPVARVLHRRPVVMSLDYELFFANISWPSYLGIIVEATFSLLLCGLIKSPLTQTSTLDPSLTNNSSLQTHRTEGCMSTTARPCAGPVADSVAGVFDGSMIAGCMCLGCCMYCSVVLWAAIPEPVVYTSAVIPRWCCARAVNPSKLYTPN